MGIDFKNITRNPLTSVAGAIVFFLTVYVVYNGKATLTEASPFFLLTLWLIGTKDPKVKSKPPVE